MSRKPRIWQYRVTDVGGSMVGRIEVGALTLDRWRGHSHTYHIWDRGKLDVTGFYSVKLEGEATSEQAQSIHENWRLAREGKQRAA